MNGRARLAPFIYLTFRPIKVDYNYVAVLPYSEILGFFVYFKRTHHFFIIINQSGFLSKIQLMISIK